MQKVVLAAVKQCGAALQYAHQDLRADVEVVREAVRTGATNLRFAAAGVYISSLLALLVQKYKY